MEFLYFNQVHNMIFYRMINICARLRADNEIPPVPPADKQLIIAEDGTFIVSEDGKFLITE